MGSSLFCNTVLSLLFAIISLWCLNFIMSCCRLTVFVPCLSLAVALFGLWCKIDAFPRHNQLLYEFDPFVDKLGC